MSDNNVTDAQEKKINQRRFVILFGGETGNSEDLAKRIAFEAKRRHFDVVLFPFDEYTIRRLVNEPLIVYICATTGQGEEPSTMKKFWRFIMRRELPDDALSAHSAIVIGLGDSSYLRFNVVAIKLYKRLKSLGAKLPLEICLGDDQHDLGLHAAVDPFLEKMWNKLDVLYPLAKETQLINSEALPKPTYMLLTKENMEATTEGPTSPYSLKSYDICSPYLSTVINNQRITSDDHFQDVRHIVLEIDDEFCMKFSPGDVVCILPENLSEDVQSFFELTGLKPEDSFSLKKIDTTVTYNRLYDTIPTLCTNLELVTKYMSIHDVPKRYFFELFWKFSKDDVEKNKLKELASTEGQQELYNYCTRPKRTILEVMRDFHQTTKQVPFEYLFDLIPSIRPRSFSCASSLKLFPRQVHILVAVVNHRTTIKSRRLGLCSNYLARLDENSRVRLWISKGNLTLPASAKTPVIMIGPGTGVAPFRSLIQERVADNIPSSFLFFGCRFRQKDFFFEGEWSESQARGLLYYYVAFSRDNVGKKEYVQHKLAEQKKLIWELLDRCDAHIIVAGNANRMPSDVRQTLVRILEAEGGEEMQGSKAENFISRMESKGKLQYDVWS
ncbi:NADPH-dependent diflavin oxidoreductase 1-like protein [Leptotrombidium deliense]|uniref:NADPH-dependent diflavin oxidoreductase 1 n=1 Tax=Leptotrombidium deliense TaxID=299467 RepID=A0A443S4Y5_9ACAR|nr:NADPH-dependent diflavin oxidoreductase 1-like protein [Leptotrombidium deliense]